ncbi:MAG: hypothetical protein IPG49_09205 [Proteobacteria bacterium]|nr:hypothetical protein [Pseudomonadota bacterium]
MAGGAIQAAGHPARGMFILPLCAISVALLATWGLAKILHGQNRFHSRESADRGAT